MNDNPRNESPRYAVMVDDNFHFMDEDERYCAGTFDTYEAAVAHAKAMVRESINKSPRDTPEETLEVYKGFGDDPFVVPIGNAPMPEERFSAWAFAEKVVSGEDQGPRKRRGRKK